MNQDAGGSAPVPTQSELAMERTRLARDRTMMAWVRTAASLIGLGFTIYKFFEYLMQSGQPLAPHRLISPRQYALLMVSIGVIILAIATIDHYLAMRQFRAITGRRVFSLATAPAALISILGMVALIAVWFRL